VIDTSLNLRSEGWLRTRQAKAQRASTAMAFERRRSLSGRSGPRSTTTV
jgi:hypothetical protein